ncbi:MAG: RnfABCDGE type electron transport complex subunit D [Treponema sp.]|nr:RnfABCDGE type electron transport complex subunit D [Treponema sp.]
MKNRVTLRPFVYIYPSMHTISVFMLIMLLPQLIMLLLTKSYGSIGIIISAVLASLAAEFLTSFVKKNFTFSWIISIIQGILVGFLLPATYEPLAVFFITIFTFIICKYSFGGVAESWINVVSITVAVCYFLGMSEFPSAIISLGNLQSKNASLSLIQDGTIPMNPKDDAITSFLNSTIFKSVGVRIPNGYVTLFWDTGSIIPAFRFNFITLVSSIILFSFEMIDFLIPAIFITVYGLLIYFVPAFFFGVDILYGDIFLAMLTSGVLFSALFILQWFGTVPSAIPGKVLYGIGAGIMCYLIVGYGMSSAGFVFMILIMNMFALGIEVIERHKVKKNIQKCLLPRVRFLREGE